MKRPCESSRRSPRVLRLRPAPRCPPPECQSSPVARMRPSQGAADEVGNAPTYLTRPRGLGGWRRPMSIENSMLDVSNASIAIRSDRSHQLIAHCRRPPHSLNEDCPARCRLCLAQVCAMAGGRDRNRGTVSCWLADPCAIDPCTQLGPARARAAGGGSPWGNNRAISMPHDAAAPSIPGNMTCCGHRYPVVSRGPHRMVSGASCTWTAPRLALQVADGGHGGTTRFRRNVSEVSSASSMAGAEVRHHQGLRC